MRRDFSRSSEHRRSKFVAAIFTVGGSLALGAVIGILMLIPSIVSGYLASIGWFAVRTWTM